jgi:hypothetical protein
MHAKRRFVSWGSASIALLLAGGALNLACGSSTPAAGQNGSGGFRGAGAAGGRPGFAGGGGAATDAGGDAPGTSASGACTQPSPGAVWTPVPIASARAAIDVVSTWAAASNDVWLVATGIHSTTPGVVVRDDQIQHWNGTTWTTSLDGFPDHIFNAVYGFGPADVWAVGDRAMHWNGTTWTDMTPPGVPGAFPLQAVWGLASNDVWTVGGGLRGPGGASGGLALFHWNGSAWTVAPTAPAEINTLNEAAIWGAATNDVWTLGGFPASHDFLGILHWDGTTWTELLGPTLTNYSSEQGQVSGLWGSAANDIWGVGFSFSGSQIWHYDGKAWTHVAVPAFNGGLTSVWGFCAADVWAVGVETPPGAAGVDQQVGIVLHWDGSAWSRVNIGIPARGLSAVSGVSTDDLWAGGRTGEMLHRHP